MVDLLMGINGNGIKTGEYIAGIIIAVLVCFAIYVGIMALYIFTRKKRPSAKYWIELLFISVGLIFSVFTKLLVLYDIRVEDGDIDHSIWGYIAYSLSAIYSLVGSLQFEGLQFSFSEMPVWQTCLYYGSSLISGLILLSVITAKASYEIYSLVSLRFSRIIDRIAKRNSVYIFNSLTKDSIILAKSIKEHEGKKAVIIFAGSNIPAFSRTDPLCREIMSNSFYYYSLSSGNDTKHSVFSRLKLKKCNVSLFTSDMELNSTTDKKVGNKNKQKRLCEFYFELDENKKPNQEKNTTDAFNELDLIIKDSFDINYKNKKIKKISNAFVDKINTISAKDELSKLENEIERACLEYFYNISEVSRWCVTEHYILTFSDSNYEFYNKQLKEKVENIMDGLLVKLKLLFNDCNGKIKFEEIEKVYNKALSDYLTASNQVHVVNEAHLSSISLLEERLKAVGKDKFSDGSSALLKHLGYAEKENKDYKVLILGFGGNGQCALNALFYNSPIINKEYKFNGFFADVFDQNMHELDGIFSKNHPLYKSFTTIEGDAVSVDICEEVYDENKAQKNMAKKTIIHTDDTNYIYKEPYYSGGNVKNKFDMTFPIIQYHNNSCTSLDFINFFDSVTGTIEKKTKKKYNIIVISFGSDRTNINIANTIIDDIRRECYYKTETNNIKQCIAVNIRDKDNLDKLNWTETDKNDEKLKGVAVFSFGAKENIYSYDKILDYKKQYEYSTNYESMQKFIVGNKEILTLSEKLSEDFNNGNTDISGVKCEDIIDTILAQRGEANNEKVDRIENQISYLKLDNTKKEVNRISAVFSAVVREEIEFLIKQQTSADKLNYNTIKALLKLEHEKWCRFYIANGWIYNKDKITQFKMHDCILPLRSVDSSKYGYDLINVIMQWKAITDERNKELR